MDEVYKARDRRLDRMVAVKFSRAAFTDRFQREARAIAALARTKPVARRRKVLASGTGVPCTGVP